MNVQAEKEKMLTWKKHSPDEVGFFEVVKPLKDDCTAVHMFRLNLKAGNTFSYNSKELEMNFALISGKCEVKTGAFDETLNQFDSFYVPGNTQIDMKAVEDVVFYIGGAVCEGYGKTFMRRYDPDLPLGEIRANPRFRSASAMCFSP